MNHLCLSSKGRKCRFTPRSARPACPASTASPARLIKQF